MSEYSVYPKHWLPLAVWLAFLTVFTGCGPSQLETKAIPALESDTSGETAQAHPPTAPPKPPLSLPPQAVTIRRTEAKVLPTVTLNATAEWSDGEGWYYQLPLPDDIRARGLFDTYTQDTSPHPAWVPVPLDASEELTLCDWSQVDGRAALVTPQTFPIDSEAPSELFLRVDGKEAFARDAVLTLIVQGCDFNNRWSKPGASRKIRVILRDAKKGNKSLQKSFRLGMADWFEGMAAWEEFSNFSTFAAHRLNILAGEKMPEEKLEERRVQRATELNDMMDFYTGQSSVRAAMAMDNAIGTVPQKEKQKVRLDSISGVEKQTRDYGALLAAAGKTTSTPDPISRYLPADTLVAIFSSLGEFARLTRVLDEKLGDVARLAESAPGHFMLEKRYAAQLGLEFSGMAELLGDVAAGATAVVLGDPYLREGTDVSLVFLNRNTALLLKALATHAQAAGDAHGGLQKETLSMAGATVNHLTSADGVVSRFEVALPEVTLVSNSGGGMTRLLEVYNGRHPSLEKAPDYRYARGIVPYDAKEESAFLYVGDSLVHALTSPVGKIAESRRMRARERLMAVNYAALLFGWMKGRPPESQAELLASPFLGKGDLKHADGSSITWSPKEGARSPWGTASHIIPVVDMAFDKVSESERDAYGQFVTSYNDYWRGRLDPALMRIKRHPKTDNLDVRVHILPISRDGAYSDVYNLIQRMAGDVRVISASDIHGLTMSLALGKDSMFKQMGQGYLAMFSGQQMGLGLFGDWMEGGLWESARFQQWLRDRISKETEGNPEAPEKADGPYRSFYEELAPHLPVFIGIEIGNPLTFTAALAVARTSMLKVSEGLLTWEADEPYGEIPVTRISMSPNSYTGSEKIDLYYAIAGGVFYAALQRDILEIQIDRALNGQLPVDVQPGEKTDTHRQDEAAQFASFVAPEQSGWMSETATEVLGAMGMFAHRQAVVGRMLLQRGMGNSGENLQESAITSLGYWPQSPTGGEFETDRSGMVTHPWLGSPVAPSRPTSMGNTPIGNAIRSIFSGLFTVSTYNRGGETELVTTAKIRFRE